MTVMAKYISKQNAWQVKLALSLPGLASQSANVTGRTLRLHLLLTTSRSIISIIVIQLIEYDHFVKKKAYALNVIVLLNYVSDLRSILPFHSWII
jgi:hypothetical protein